MRCHLSKKMIMFWDHTNFPCPLADGNESSDKFTNIIALSQVQLVQKSHILSYQNCTSLRRQFPLTRENADQIVKQFDICPQYLLEPDFGVNPQGLFSNYFWQMDAPHVTEFDKLKYLHAVVTTYSGFLMTTANVG